jgi:DNA-binding beta-propeller fold protein YncE
MILRLLVPFCSTLVCAMGYTHLEPRQQHPVTLTPDGRKLLALHSTAHMLSVFDVGTPPRSKPLLVAEISVSTAPVTVRARTNDEAWVVNEGSDSVSVISLSQGLVIDTLRVADEPADVCFANGKAFVSCSQKRLISVFDATTRGSLGQINIDGVSPRAMVASGDGGKLYVACLYSGNRTTILRPDAAPAQPAPTNPALPAPPRTALIVPADDSRVNWNVLDHDIAEINTATQTIERWISGVGTHLFDLAIHPDGSLWCANSDSLNLTRFEPELNGHFALHRLSRIALPDGTVTHQDLNPGITRATSPHPPSIALSLAAPGALAFRGDGQRAWVAAFQSDRIAEIDSSTGSILRRVDLRQPGGESESMRGPRGIVLTADRLYVLNKISDTLTTLHPADGSVLSEIPLGSIDPMPPGIRAGRGVLYDARLSGNGTLSCATCHVDADRDGLAWDLGDPGGGIFTVTSAGLSSHDSTLYTQDLHPMKGPLTTQTLRGLATNDADPLDPIDGAQRPPAAIVTKFHWRGDKPSIQSFNSTFPNLMGGSLQTSERMDRMADYLRSIVHPPNPNLNPDRSLRADLPEGDAVKGRTVFLNHSQSHCIVCHDLPAGTDQNVDDFSLIERSQPFKNPPLRTVYQRAGIFLPTPGSDSLSGFGLGADGSAHALPTTHPYTSLALIHRPPITASKAKALADLTAFVLSFDTGTAPSAGYDLTLNHANKTNAGLLALLTTLETRATAGDNGLVAWGRVAGSLRRYQWSPTLSLYLAEDQSATLTRNALLDLIAPGDSLTFAGVLPSETSWRGTDRDGDGTADVLEAPPSLDIRREGNAMHLRWPDVKDWYPESSPDMTVPWQPSTGEGVIDGAFRTMPIPNQSQPGRFYRLRRTW